MIEMIPKVEYNAPDRHDHDPLCGCTNCCEKPLEDIRLVPFLPSRQEARDRGEETATLTYGGVTIELTYTYVHHLIGLTSENNGSPFMRRSHRAFNAGLETILRRMYKKSMENKS